jgi:crotonobetainyl-CoA:carnitine CoA-transferase CaiB-like acyl-CoA transferase
MGNGASLPLVGPPVQFDERAAAAARAPEVGEHTEAVLLEAGLSWPEITALKDQGIIT